MDVVEGLQRCGGRGTWGQLRALGVPRRSLRRRLDRGLVVRSRRGSYRLAMLDTAVDTAIQVAATLSHRSAAAHHGWDVATAPERPEVLVRRNRNLQPTQRALVLPRWRDLAPYEERGSVTTPLRTVLDCARDLPFREALAVADSALRAGVVEPAQLQKRVSELRGPGAAQARRVVGHANGRAANAFESVVRALAIEAGLDVRPQVEVTEHGLWALVDLADRSRRLVIEADSFTHHGNRRGFRKDVRRYTEFVVFGWCVLRVTWEDAMVQPRYVRWAFQSWRLYHDQGVLPGPPPEHLPRLA